MLSVKKLDHVDWGGAEDDDVGFSGEGGVYCVYGRV